MAKPISWLKRAPEIRIEVGRAKNSHFDRKDIQRIFELQPRAANALMEAMPRVRYGTGHIVGGEALVELLDDVLAAPDVPAMIEARRAANLYVSRRKPRTVVLKEKLGNGLASLPDCVSLTRGKILIQCDTTFEAVEAMMILISNTQGDDAWYEFCRIFETERPVLPSESSYEAIRLGREAMVCLKAGYAARAGDYARQAAHHAHWVQVERATISIEEYDREMEVLEGVAGGVNLLRNTLSGAEGLVRFSDLKGAQGEAVAAPKREPAPAATDYAWTKASA